MAAMIVVAVSCAPKGDAVKSEPTKVDLRDEEPITEVSANDSEMSAAIAKARSTLPAFYARLKHPGPGETDFSLKVKFTEGEDTEHIWVSELQGPPGKMTGTINDTPEYVHSLKLGQRVPIPGDKISDWLYILNGKMVGNATLRALFKTMTPDQVKEAKGMLADP